VEDSTEVSTLISQESKEKGRERGRERRRRRSTKTLRKLLLSNELPCYISCLVNILKAKNAKAKAFDSVDELKAEFNGLKEKMKNLEARVSNILSILSRN